MLDLESLKKELNPQQYRAVTTTEGAILIIAGAGSGKTRVITFRIAHMLDKGIPQSSILALTFTNKAAKEMADRIKTLTEKKLQNLTVSTFHAFGVKVLRQDIEKLGYRENFSIYDNKVLYGLSAISGIGEKLSDSIIQERDANGKFTGLNNLIDRVPITVAQIVTLIKSGAIPTRNKKQCLINYLKNNFPNETFTYNPVKTYKTKQEMLDVWGIDVDKYKVGKKVDKEAVLAEYNKRKEKKERSEFYEKRERQYQEYISSCTEKYLQNEDFWEFEALQIFLSNNPFKDAYTYLRPFDHKLYRGIFPAWDNTARRQFTPDIFWGSTPKLYETWLSDLAEETINNDELDEKMIFVNAWNEWAEGACLEPDRNYGYAYLQATRNVLDNYKTK